MGIRQTTKQALDAIGLLKPVKRVLGPARSSCRNAVHVLNEIGYRVPRPLPGPTPEMADRSDVARSLSEELEKKGIVVLPEFLTSNRLAGVQAAFASMVSRVESGPNGPEKLSPAGYLPQTLYLEDENSREARIVCSNNPFKHAREFLSISTDPLILGIVAGYLKRPFYLQQAIASRYLPMTPSDFGSFQWHHDGWGRKVNVMFLLTDVSDDDQYMTFIEGSHLALHSLDRCRESRYLESEVSVRFPGHNQVRCTGKAGTVFIFDSNGMHRGNRSSGKHRDTLITSFNAGRYVWTFEVPREFREGMSSGQLDFLQRWSRVRWEGQQ